MNDEDAARLLARRVEGVSGGVIPVDGVIAAGRSSVRRRRRTTTAGAALLSAAVVAGGVLIQQGATEEAVGPVAGDDKSSAHVLDAPAGTRLVGMGQVVVAVPSSWSTGETRCLKPAADTVYLETGAMTDCATEPSVEELKATSSLAISTESRNYGFMRLDEMAPASPVDGYDVLEGPVACDRAVPHRCSQEFAVPSEGIAFRVSVTDPEAEAQVAAVRESLRVLPAGYAAVPLGVGYTPAYVGMPKNQVDELESAIDNAGLGVEIVEEYRAGMDAGSYLYSEPALGSPVRDGYTITLSVSTQDEPQPATTAPSDPEEEPDPDGVAASFLAYARGESDSLPVDTTVALYLGNQYVKTIAGWDVTPSADDRPSWNVCATYAERSCPLSAVRTLRELQDEPVVTDSLVSRFCLNTLARAPTDMGGSRMAVLRPAEPRDCTQDFAVQVWYNSGGEITAVNLLLGSP